MRVTVWHNFTTDAQGRPVGMLDGYSEDHALVCVAAFEAEEMPGMDLAPPTMDPMTILERIFFLFNVGDDAGFGEPDPLALAYRARGHRSLSVGDVVQVGDDWFACAHVGWQRIVKPARVAWEAATDPATALGGCST